MTEHDKQFKEDFIQVWEQFMEPLFKDGAVTFECSSTLKEHLLKAGDYEYTDDEIWDLMNAGKM